MSRKRPSVHSDDQFALFLEKIKAMRDADQDARFEAAVSKLIRRKGQPADRSAEPSRTAVDGSNGAERPRAVPAKSVLRPKSDVDGVDVVGHDTEADHANLMPLIGHLMLGWSNNESVLIYILMLLLETDERSAAAVFSILKTTDARIDLVRKLAQLKVGDPALRAELERMVERLDEAGRLRDEFLHGMYAVDKQGRITRRQTSPLAGKRDRISLDVHRPIDGKRIESLVASRNGLWELNRQLWDFLPRLQASVARTARAQAKSNTTTP